MPLLVLCNWLIFINAFPCNPYYVVTGWGRATQPPITQVSVMCLIRSQSVGWTRAALGNTYSMKYNIKQSRKQYRKCCWNKIIKEHAESKSQQFKTRQCYCSNGTTININKRKLKPLLRLKIDRSMMEIMWYIPIRVMKVQSCKKYPKVILEQRLQVNVQKYYHDKSEGHAFV